MIIKGYKPPIFEKNHIVNQNIYGYIEYYDPMSLKIKSGKFYLDIKNKLLLDVSNPLDGIGLPYRIIEQAFNVSNIIDYYSYIKPNNYSFKMNCYYNILSYNGEKVRIIVRTVNGDYITTAINEKRVLVPFELIKGYESIQFLK